MRFVLTMARKQQRVRHSPGDNRYQGTAGDFEGVASEAAGNAFHWRYERRGQRQRWLLL